MAGDRVKLEVLDRGSRGSAASRRLRGEGLVPGILYGAGEPHAFAVPERDLRRALTGEHGTHAILDVVLEGKQKPHHAVLKDYQLDPTKPRILHVDLHEVRLDQAIQSSVAVELTGTPEGVVQGGVLSLVLRDVHVEALPMEVPYRLTFDVSGLVIGDAVRVGDLTAPAGVTILDDPDAVIATVAHPTRVVVPEEEVAAEAAAEAEAAAGEAGEAESPSGE